MVENKTRTGLLLLILVHFEEINGRTRIQKILYLTDLIGWNVMKDYHFYQYGPYSQWLKRALDILVQRKLIEENQEEISDEKIIYKYKITEDGSKYFQTMNLPPDLVEKTKTFLDKLKKFSTDDLEIMSSLYFIRKSDPEVDTNERLVKFIKLYKPWYNETKIENNLEVFPLMEPFIKN